MDGTHQRLLECFGKEIPVYYLCIEYNQARYMADRAHGLYERYGFFRKSPQRFENKTKNLMLEFRTLSNNTYDRLCGFRGAVLIHPEVYLHPSWNQFKNVQEVTIHCNMRHKPWQT